MKKFFGLLTIWLFFSLSLFAMISKAVERNMIQKDLVIHLFEEDNILVYKFEDFNYDGVNYRVKFIKSKVGRACGKGENILLNEEMLNEGSYPGLADRLKRCLDNGGRVVVQTSHAPYILIQKLHIPMMDVAPGNYYDTASDVAGFAVYKSGGVYYVGYGRLYNDKRFSKQYYDLILQGFVT